MKTIILILFLACLTSNARATLIVHDVINFGQQTAAQIENFAKFVQMVQNEVAIIENQAAQIEQQGDASYVVQMLKLDPITGVITQLKQGVQTVEDVREAANGADALVYTASGLFDDLSLRR